jgi:signal transduction histidine kinase
MKPAHTRHSRKASRSGAKTSSDDAATHHRHDEVRGTAAKVRAEREHAAARHTGAEVERLMGQMREANERLIVAAIHAQNLSDEASTDAAEARKELDDLMNQLRAANEQLAASAAQAHTMAEEASEREEEYRRLSSQLLNLQDEERRRLARDLHDSTGQRLAALTMHLDIVEDDAKALDARSRRALADSRSLAEQCVREVRTLAYLLHPPMLDEIGLVSAVRWYVEGFTKRSGVHVIMDAGEIGRLPAPIETAIFRVVQEGLTNVHRHASTTTASIRLSATADAVALEIHDEGQGLGDAGTHRNGARRPEALGVGIQGMRERIRQLGGTFNVEFTDNGTAVFVRVPLNADTP